MILRAYVAGQPRPQPRARFINGRVVSTANMRAKVWKNSVVAALRRALQGRARIERPVGLWCESSFHTPRQERWGKPHAFRPDKDNIEKLVMDSLMVAGVVKDDSLVCEGSMRKVWAMDGGLTIMLLEPGEFPPNEADDLGALAIES